MNDQVFQIRANSATPYTTQQKMWKILFVLVLGALLGFLAKYTDGTMIGLIGTNLGFWIFVTTIVAAWSRTPVAAALHAFVFLAAMLIVYYVYSMLLFGFFPRYYFYAWGSIALLSPIGGYLVWFARGTGWAAAICAALPISFLLVEGYSFVYTFSFPQGFALLAAVILYLCLPANGSQRLRMLPIVLTLSVVLERIGILTYLPG